MKIKNPIFPRYKHTNSSPELACKNILMPNSKRSNSQLRLDNSFSLFPRHNRSQAHVEIMVSFAIFIGAIIFIFAIFSPASEPSKKQYDMPKIKKIIMNNISSDVGVLNIIINSSINCLENCNCYNITTSNYLQANYIEVNFSDNKRRLYSIYFSDIFPENKTHLNKLCENNLHENYSLGSYHVENIVAEKRLKELNISYTADYNKLKNELGINYDFSFIVMKLDNTILPELSAEKKTNARVEKISENIPIRVIDNSGQIEERILNIRMW